MELVYKELEEMDDLIFHFRYAFAEKFAAYDPEKGDIEKNAYEMGTMTIDELADWVDEEKAKWKLDEC